MVQVIPNCGIGAEGRANALAFYPAAQLLRDPIDERKKFRGSVCFIDLDGFKLSLHDPMNKIFRVTIGHTGGLYMLFLGGCATRLGNDVGSPVIKASHHTTLDVFTMMGVKSKTLYGVG